MSSGEGPGSPSICHVTACMLCGEERLHDLHRGCVCAAGPGAKGRSGSKSTGKGRQAKRAQVPNSSQFDGPASPWQQEKKQIGRAEARGHMEAKACGCAGFSFDFVCGLDGVTYANPCMAQCGGTQVSYTGPCEATWSAIPKSSTVKGIADSNVISTGVGAGSNSPGNSPSSSSSSSTGSSPVGSSPVSSSIVDEELYRDDVLDQRTADLELRAGANGDYEYYYDDGRAPVPAPPRRQAPGAAPAPLPPGQPGPARIPTRPLPPSDDDGESVWACARLTVLALALADSPTRIRSV